MNKKRSGFVSRAKRLIQSYTSYISVPWRDDAAAMPPDAHIRANVLGSVLLVEDNLRVSEELSLVLESAGYTTRCAYDGEHMRAMMAVHTPHVVMLDLNLPNEDGISLCKWLREVYPSLGIVMLTARVMGKRAHRRLPSWGRCLSHKAHTP